jgi:hypothetical protein
MKFNILSFALAASVAALPVNEISQETKIDDATKPPLKTMEQLAPRIEPAVIVDVEPLLRAGAKRQLVRYGPFLMPASKVRYTSLFVVPIFGLNSMHVLTL